MDTDPLVDNLIEDGRKLVEELPQRGFDVAAAFWIKNTEDGRWRYYVVSPVVDTAGVIQAYRQLQPVIRAMPQPFGISPLEVTVIGPSDPIARDVLAAIQRTPGPRSSPIRWGGIYLGNVSVEGAYLYPVPAAASS